MYVVKGFASHAALANNTPGIVAPIGELSTQALTYAKDKGLYKSNSAPDIRLTTFLAKNDDVPVVLNSDVNSHIYSIVSFVYSKIMAGGSTIAADDLLAQLITTFAASANTFTCGPIVSDGTYSAPEWLSWRATSLSGITDNTFKVWFVDAAFRSQYDEYDIVVVPPVDVLNNFFKTGSEVRTMLEALTPSIAINRVQTLKANTPETVIRAETYEYIDPYNSANKIKTTWHLLIYGAAGNNIDAIKDALTAYCLANSTHTRDEWIAILPDLFRRTEFIVVPMWDQYALPNRVIESGIYSPNANLKRALALLKQVVTAYPSAHIDNYASILSHPYKSLQLLAIGSPENRNSWFELRDVFADYIAVGTTSADFNRMQTATKEWVLMINDMLIIAEGATELTPVPAGMARIKRGNVVYIVKSIDNINYLVAAKGNLTTVIDGEV